MLMAVTATFLAVLFLMLSIYSLRNEHRVQISSRLQNYAGGKNKSGEEEEEESGTGGGKKLFTRPHKTKEEVIDLEKDDWKSKLKKELSQADIPLKVEEFLGFCALGGVFAGFILYLLTMNGGMFIIGLVLGTFLLPWVILKRAKAKRVQNFNQQLAGALSTMANSLRVGFSLFQAMKSLSEEMPSPLSTEFKRTLQEINLGTPTDQALQNMCKRIKSDDLELVVMAIVIQRQVGGNLAEVLDNIAHTIRERIRIQREVKTLTSQGRISGLIIGLLPFILALIITVINPEYMYSFLEHPLGYFLIGLGLISQLIGVLFIRKIVNIQW